MTDIQQVSGGVLFFKEVNIVFNGKNLSLQEIFSPSFSLTTPLHAENNPFFFQKITKKI